jgi:hypothetical protein
MGDNGGHGRGDFIAVTQFRENVDETLDDAKVEEGEKGEEDGGAMEKGENGAIKRGKGFVLLRGEVEEFIEFEMVFVVDVSVGSMMDRMVEHPVGRSKCEDAVESGQDAVRCTIGKIGFMAAVVENDKGTVELETEERDNDEIRHDWKTTE